MTITFFIRDIILNFSFAYFLLGFVFVESLEKRDADLPMKTSIIIPCYYKHFEYIHDLLVHYQNQTVLPDEIVISLSESQKVSEGLVNSIKNIAWPFSVKILESQKKLTAGQNRNKASSNSQGDLLICQDADDIPHPQRVEIIKRIFEQFKVDHLLHFWMEPKSVFEFYESEEFENLCCYFKKYDQAAKVKRIKNGGGIHNGNNAYTREVFNLIQWPENKNLGEDVAFNRSVYALFRYKVVVNASLLIYRNHLSAFSD